MQRWIVFLLVLFGCCYWTSWAGPPTGSATTAARRFFPENGWLRSIAALSKPQQEHDYVAEEVAVKAKKKKKKRRNPMELIRQELTESTGTYYGFAPVTMKQAIKDERSKQVNVKDTVSQTLQELRSMRQEMQALRKELYEMKRSVIGLPPEDEPDNRESILAQRVQKYNRISHQVEAWAKDLLFNENNNNTWTEVHCNKVMRHLNPNARTRAYLTYLKDSRTPDPSDNRLYPCLKVFATIDAPLDKVCWYLSRPEHLPQYNDLVVDHGDVETLSPDSKICWGHTPKILFIQPREFVTYCRHWWNRNGDQVMINQAEDGDNHRKLPRAFALRGAQFLSRDPHDPSKTRVALIAHANPGRDIPDWAIKTAVKAVAPIEPFKLFHKINKEVGRLDDLPPTATLVSNGRTSRPAGMGQLGFACFWPKGGGLVEGAVDTSNVSTVDAEASITPATTEELSPVATP